MSSLGGGVDERAVLGLVRRRRATEKRYVEFGLGSVKEGLELEGIFEVK